MDLVSDVITKSTVSGKLVSTPPPPSNLPPARYCQICCYLVRTSKQCIIGKVNACFSKLYVIL